MGFIKVVKDKAYHKRFQTKYRRRREGKTDYYARKRLVAQAKNKYGAHKYRFVVRFSNRDVVCQVAYSTIEGDIIVAAAYSHELPLYGVKLGLTNYAAAYCTGLLLARRILTKFHLDKRYQGNLEASGADYNVAPNKKGPNPFKCLLDVGLARTTTGSRVFSAMKGMCDGGVNVPHSDKRFVGYNEEKSQLDAKILRKYIFGGHVAAYMKLLLEKSPEKYAKLFSRYKAANIKPQDIENIYAEAHKKIRENPLFVKKPAKNYTREQLKKYRHPHKLSLKQRKKAIAAKRIKLGLVDTAPAAEAPADAPADAPAAETETTQSSE
ncbi:60S ribosomal protein L5 [Pelomyxa schiedti]|nr:60S ribosomal protein L5 [Pelomyxa schiedti]